MKTNGNAERRPYGRLFYFCYKIYTLDNLIDKMVDVCYSIPDSLGVGYPDGYPEFDSLKKEGFL